MFTVWITELLKKQMKKISNKDRLWAENLKKLQLLQEQKIAFSKCKYSFMYKPHPLPPEYKPSPKKNLAKRPFDQKQAPGLIIRILWYINN